MGQLAFLKMFILVAISLDVNDNRRHVHVFLKGKRHQHSLAKIWIEKNGQQCVEIAESELLAKDNDMCKIKGVTLGIKDLNFKAHRGKMLVRLTDGREVLVPVSFFPDIQHMPVKEREKWMVLDDQYFTFENMTRVYSVLDLLKVA